MTDTYILKLSGKSELPRDIEIGGNWHISLEGAITSKTTTDSDDGTYCHTYLFKPIKIDLLDPKGKTLKLKDTRSRSSLLRSRLWAIWKEQDMQEDFESFYDKLLTNLIRMAPEVIEMFGK